MEKREVLFTNKDLKKLIIPLIIEQLLTVTVGLADSIMISSVGEAAVSGVSLEDSIMILLINMFSALATGGAVVAGQYLGQKKHVMACKTADQLILFISALAVVIMAGIYAMRGFILHGVFGAIEPAVMHSAEVYLLIVKNVIEIAKGLQFQIVAEGVEGRNQYEILKRLDCDYIQGYFFSTPLPPEEFEQFLEKETVLV